jgi:uncharacterized protein YjgD (DUF1641 family)
MIKFELTQDELTALAGLIDAGVKTLGLASVKQAASLLTKLEAAVAEANAKPSEQETE